jgi:hypothetical protein
MNNYEGAARRNAAILAFFDQICECRADQEARRDCYVNSSFLKRFIGAMALSS